MRKRKTQSEIYEAALSIYAGFGYGKSTLEDIAARLDMTKSSLYLYARSKEDLYEKTVRYALTRWQEHVLERTKGIDDPSGRLKTLFISAFDYLTGDNDFRRVLVRDPAIFSIDPGRDRYRDINERAVGMIREILEAGIAAAVFRDIRAEDTARYLFSIYIMFIMRTYVFSGEVTARELFDTAVDINIEGLLKRN